MPQIPPSRSNVIAERSFSTLTELAEAVNGLIEDAKKATGSAAVTSVQDTAHALLGRLQLVATEMVDGAVIYDVQFVGKYKK